MLWEESTHPFVLKLKTPEVDRCIRNLKIKGDLKDTDTSGSQAVCLLLPAACLFWTSPRNNASEKETSNRHGQNVASCDSPPRIPEVGEKSLEGPAFI